MLRKSRLVQQAKASIIRTICPREISLVGGGGGFGDGLGVGGGLGVVVGGGGVDVFGGCDGVVFGVVDSKKI